MVRTQIQLDEKQLVALKSRAAQEGVSMAELVRRGVDLVLASANGGDAEERIKRAIAVAGRFSSGVPDLSTNHDRYFTEDEE
ncbi:CopG family transcriptional regulator [Gelria sp. Kuro-4]|uniref:ribbon-helix-helix domain-containing protein n=1 Tax=Gelria sp. Kuro-4 TaxID=2796927 RepID=UPI001BF043ED|nr:CopG family transcriptional regulator [Gelria sp. Kuro-4]BCV24021.1 hypothetical protein kuro4_07940 [Gelria sp. Kuro-4]